jgi:hypothetical protein
MSQYIIIVKISLSIKIGVPYRYYKNTALNGVILILVIEENYTYLAIHNMIIYI